MIMRGAMALFQVVGLLAVLLGVWLALPLWAALVVDGALVAAVGVAIELVLTRRPSAPSDGRDGAPKVAVA